MKSKLLVRINNLDELEDYKKEGIENFLFPLYGFSVGYDSFRLDELKKIDCNVFLLVNRVFDNDACDKFRVLKNDLDIASGIIYEDIAVFQILKDTNVNLIWNQAHFAVNYHSINFWLDNDRIDSAMISNELEASELNLVINNVNKKVILPVFGLNMAMYSRRFLLKFYSKTFDKEFVNTAILKNRDTVFLAKENEFGTVLFYNKYFNLISEIDNFNDENILYYYVDPNGVDSTSMIGILNGKSVDYDNKFYEKKTVFKVGDLK